MLIHINIQHTYLHAYLYICTYVRMYTHILKYVRKHIRTYHKIQFVVRTLNAVGVYIKTVSNFLYLNTFHTISSLNYYKCTDNNTITLHQY